jgi:hypothetical protein
MIDEEEVPTVIRKPKCNVLWFQDKQGFERWACRNQLSSYGFKMDKTHCWLGSCPGRIGKLVDISEPVKPEAKDICNHYGCSEKIASSRKKYCSDRCRLRKARADYEKRNPDRKKKKK